MCEMAPQWHFISGPKVFFAATMAVICWTVHFVLIAGLGCHGPDTLSVHIGKDETPKRCYLMKDAIWQRHTGHLSSWLFLSVSDIFFGIVLTVWASELNANSNYQPAFRFFFFFFFWRLTFPFSSSRMSPLPITFVLKLRLKVTIEKSTNMKTLQGSVYTKHRGHAIFCCRCL